VSYLFNIILKGANLALFGQISGACELLNFERKFLPLRVIVDAILYAPGPGIFSILVSDVVFGLMVYFAVLSPIVQFSAYVPGPGLPIPLTGLCLK
jgi:hypothetical protein